MVWTYTALAQEPTISGSETQVESHAPEPDFEYSIVGDIVFISSTRSFGRADVSNWTLSPRSKVVEPVAAGGDGIGGISWNSTSSTTLLVEFLSLPISTSLALKVETPDGIGSMSEVSKSI